MKETFNAVMRERVEHREKLRSWSGFLNQSLKLYFTEDVVSEAYDAVAKA